MSQNSKAAMPTISTDSLRVVVNPLGASLSSIKLKGPDGWFDIAQNGLSGSRNRRPAFINMYEYAGRLAPDGSFPFDLKEGVIDKNAARFQLQPKWHPMGLHGPANQTRFGVLSVTDSSASLTLNTLAAPNYTYPSSLLIQTEYLLEGSKMTVSVVVENVGQHCAPIGGGSHGLFAKYPRSAISGPIVKFNATKMMNKNTLYPTEAMPDGNPFEIPEEHNFTQGKVPAEIYDTVFMGWDGVCTATWEDLGLSMTVRDESDLRTEFLHLWYDAGRGTWAPEPVIAPGNAFNLEADGEGKRFGVRILKPGEKSSFKHVYEWNLDW